MKDDTISKQAVLKILNRYLSNGFRDYNGDWNEPTIDADAINEIKALSTIDAAPIKHGRWKCSDKYENAVCSVCGYDTGEAYGFGYGNGCYNFCPNCGAKMNIRDGDHS